jgi:hypothetical protein
VADRENLIAKYSGIYYAKEIHRRPDQLVRWALEGYLLSRTPLDHITSWMATSVDTVVWYTKLFFDVIPYLDADSYVATVVIGGSLQAPHDRDIGTLWKIAGFCFGGTFLRDMIRTLPMNHVTDVADISRGWQNWFARVLDRKAALAMTTIPLRSNEATVLDSWHRTRELATDHDAATAESAIAENISAALCALPFTVGRQGAIDIPALAKYDESPVELRAHEMMEVAMGLENDSHRQALTWKYPEPKERSSDNGAGDGEPGVTGPS